MITFSPNYDTITLMVMEEKSDSTHEWLEPKYRSFVREEDTKALLPGMGFLVGGHKVVTGTADVFTGISEGTWERVSLGVKNIFVGMAQAIPTGVMGLLIYAALPEPSPSQLVMVGIIYVVNVIAINTLLSISKSLFFENKTNFEKTNAPVALFYGDRCAYELYPKNYCCYTAEKWVREIYKYGEKRNHIFV